MEVYLLLTWFKGRKFSPSRRGGEILLFDNDAKVFQCRILADNYYRVFNIISHFLLLVIELEISKKFPLLIIL